MSRGLLLALALLPVAAWGQRVQRRLTQDQAIAIAAQFCRQIGAPCTAAAIAVYPAPTPPGLPDLHWQARWKVTFADQADLEVVDGTGVVSWYSNVALYQGPQPPDEPAGPAIPEDAALERGTAVLAASGQQNEIGPAWCREQQLGGVPTVRGHQWYVSWPRQYQGVSYRHQAINVTLLAETGQVVGFCVSFPSPPPPTASVAVDREPAIAAARAQMAAAGLAEGELVRVEREVVHPNDRWQPGSREMRLPGTARVAWTCRFALGEKLREVWVDCATGEVVGGTFSAPLRAATAALVPVREILAQAREVRVLVSQRGTGYGKEPAGVLSDRSNPALFRSLKATRRFLASGLLSFASHKFVIVGADGRSVALSYVASAGYLGRKGDWAVVPDDVRRWVQSLPPLQPAKGPKTP